VQREHVAVRDGADQFVDAAVVDEDRAAAHAGGDAADLVDHGAARLEEDQRAGRVLDEGVDADGDLLDGVTADDRLHVAGQRPALQLGAQLVQRQGRLGRRRGRGRRHERQHEDRQHEGDE